MEYKLKYYKYKSKYIELKQRGGSTKEEIQAKIIDLEPKCFTTTFSQHLGECWSDSIQMLFCFSDSIKESVQNKLLNLTPDEIIDFAYHNNRERFLPPIYRRSDTDIEQKKFVMKFEKRLKKYLELLQLRLCAHIEGENSICLSSKESPIYKKYNDFFHSLPSIPTLQQQSSFTHGVKSAIIGSKMSNYYAQTFYSHTADVMTQINLINILSFCFLDNDEIVVVENIFWEDLCDVDNTFGIILNTTDHSIAFHTCGNKNFFYNDNNDQNDKYEINWKNIIKECIKDKYKMYVSGIDGYLYIKKDDITYKINKSGEKIKSDTILNESYIVIELLLLYKHKIIIKNKYLNFIFLNGEIINDSVKNIKSLIAEGCDINLPVLKTYNIFFYSIQKKNSLENVKYLIENGANVNYINEEGIHLLFNLIRNKVEIKYIELLIENGANVNYVRHIYHTLLYDVIINKEEVKYIELLIEKGANVNYIDDNGYSLLFYLIKDNAEIKYIELLIEKGANVNHIDEKGYNLLFLLIYNNVEIKYVELLIEKGANVNYINNKGYSLLFSLINYGVKIKYIELLIQNGANVNYVRRLYCTLLYDVIKNKAEVKYIDLLIEKGANVNHIDDKGYILLFYLIHNNIEIKYIELLIEKGANVNYINMNSLCLLYYLVIYEVKQEYIELLIEKGADVNYIRDGKYILLFDLITNNAKLEYIQLLIKKGADVNYIDNKDCNLLLYLLFYKVELEYIKLLIEKGANVNHITTNYSILSILIERNYDLKYLKVLIENNAICIVNGITYPVLFLCVMNKSSADIIEYLISIGKDPLSIIEGEKFSTFSYCLENNYISYIDIFMCYGKERDKMYDCIKKYGSENIKEKYL